MTAPLYGRQTKEAVTLLGRLIRTARIERKISTSDLAIRVGISRDMMRRIEKGETRCAIGAVFEAANIVGVPLFVENQSSLKQHIEAIDSKLSLLPKAIHRPQSPIYDDF